MHCYNFFQLSKVILLIQQIKQLSINLLHSVMHYRQHHTYSQIKNPSRKEESSRFGCYKKYKKKKKNTKISHDFPPSPPRPPHANAIGRRQMDDKGKVRKFAGRARTSGIKIMS